MQTIKIQLEDAMYQNIVQNGIDIQTKFKEFLADFVDDGYQAITTKEAQARVSQAVQRYEDGTGEYLTDKEYETHKNGYIKKLKNKYANN